MKLKLKRRKKKTREIKTSTGEKDKSNKNTSKTNKLETRHFKLHQETSEDKKIEHELIERRTANRESTTNKRR